MKLKAPDFVDKNPEATDAYFRGVEAGISLCDDEIEEFEGQVFRLETERDVEQMTAYRMSERVTELVAQMAMLREVLGAVEWVENAEEFKDETKWCPRCKMVEHHGHDEGCQLDAALATPSPLAEAVRAVFKVVDTMMMDVWEWSESEGASMPIILNRPTVDIDNYLEKIADAWDAYRVLRDGGDADSIDGRGAIPVPAPMGDE